MSENDARSSQLSQLSIDPSVYSMESFDPSSHHEEFDPSDDEDDRKYGSRDSLGSNGSENQKQSGDSKRSRSQGSIDNLIDRLKKEREDLFSKLREEQAYQMFDLLKL